MSSEEDKQVFSEENNDEHTDKKREDKEEEEEDEDPLHVLSNPEVTTKYNTCGEISKKALKFALEQAKDGADIQEVCKATDEFIINETGKVNNKRANLDESDKNQRNEEKRTRGV